MTTLLPKPDLLKAKKILFFYRCYNQFMSEQEGAGEVLKAISTKQLLEELSRRLADSQDPKEQALVEAVKGYSKVEQISRSQSELSNPEDEFVQAVKAVTIFGKFPQGLNFGDKRLVAPQPDLNDWNKEFGYFSPTGFSLYWGLGMTSPQFIRRCLGAIEGNRGSSLFPQVSNPMSKHFLAITPYDDPKRAEEYTEGYSLLIYRSLQDQSLRDGVGRGVRGAEVTFLMPRDKAQDFIQLVEEKSNGADIVEQFVQKAAPGIMASNKDQPGVHRVQASELVILDGKFLTDLLGARNSQLRHQANENLIGVRFLESVDKAVVKPYSHPVGFGTPPS